MDFESKLYELFIDLPEPPTEHVQSAAAITVGKQVWIGGVLPFSEGKVQFSGRVGHEVRMDTAKLAARTAGILMLAILKKEAGSLNKLKRIVSLEVKVACGTEFRDHHKVADGVSEMFFSVFGPIARPIRVVSGVTSLPKSACVQISGVFEVR